LKEDGRSEIEERISLFGLLGEQEKITLTPAFAKNISCS
jgi:hypothetical protein